MTAVDDFYVGYDTPVPRESRPFVFGGVAVIAATGVMLALAVTLTQRPFADSRFAFGSPEPFTGRLVSQPYPTLVVDRAEAAGDPERLLLVALGKHGAAALVAPFEGQSVRLEGSVITRGPRRAIEVVPGSIVIAPESGPPLSPEIDRGRVTLRGEIVDGKCYLGVMNPGEGATHRDCAVRCLRGGLPPLFAVRTGDGVMAYTLTSSDRRPVGTLAADLVGRPIEITGTVLQNGEERLLLADPRTYRLLAR